MHELSIVESIVNTAAQFAAENSIEKISFVTVQVGALTGVIPKYLTMYYGDLSEGTVLAGSELKIEEIEPEAFCRACGEVFDPVKAEQHCPACGGGSFEILRGEELTVKEMGHT